MGPPLAGPLFLDIWGAMAASELFDKILSTMPADASGTLSRPQVADLVAYVLQANQFPPGSVELGSDAGLKQISLAGARASAATAVAGSTMAFPAAGTLNQVMRGVLFPSSNVLFDVQTQDPGTQSRAKPSPGRRLRLRRVTSRAVVDAPRSRCRVRPVLTDARAPLLLNASGPCDRATAAIRAGLVDVGREPTQARRAGKTFEASAPSPTSLRRVCGTPRVYRDVASPTCAARGRSDYERD